jgi:hypothetical protein
MSKVLEQAARRLSPEYDGLWLPELTVECEGTVDEWQEDDWEIDGEDYYIAPDVVSTRTYNIGPVRVIRTIPCGAECISCQGTGRVLSLTSDNIDAAMERLGYGALHHHTNFYIGAYRAELVGKKCFRYYPEVENSRGLERAVMGFGPTRTEARIAAAEAVVKSVWPEVKNGT